MIYKLDDLMIVCSWCNRIKVGEHFYNPNHEVAIAYQVSRDFQAVSHGICKDCAEELYRQNDEVPPEMFKKHLQEENK